MPTYYHGGRGGMTAGMMVLPPSITGARSTAEFGSAKVCRLDRVYITTSDQAALLFAALHPSLKGCVYEVIPIGPVLRDPDCTEDALSFECERARIVRVHRVLPSVRDAIIKHVLKERVSDSQNAGPV